MTEQFIITLIDKFESGSMRELEVSDGASRLALSKNFGALLAAPAHGAPHAGMFPPPRGANSAGGFERQGHGNKAGGAYSQDGGAYGGAAASLSQDEVDKALRGGSAGGGSGANGGVTAGGANANGGGSGANSGVTAGGVTGGGGDGCLITSPIVGTFYAAPGPDSPAFVNKGSKVKKGGTLCILEAMKMMNKLEAEFDCEILAIKVQPGQLVEFGQPLFEVRALENR